MRTTLILIVFVLTSCTSKTYLEIAENEINERIEEKLNVNDSSFAKELELFFENYVISNNVVETNENKGLIYFKYLMYVREQGSSLNKIPENSLTENIKKEIKNLELDTELGIQNLFHETVKPIVDKYDEELNNNNFKDELIIGIAETNPKDEVNLTFVIDGLLKSYNFNDFNRPFLKKFVILFVFVQLELIE